MLSKIQKFKTQAEGIFIIYAIALIVTACIAAQGDLFGIYPIALTWLIAWLAALPADQKPLADLQIQIDLEKVKNRQWEIDYADLQQRYDRILFLCESLQKQHDATVIDLHTSSDEIHRLIDTRDLLEKELAACKALSRPVESGVPFPGTIGVHNTGTPTTHLPDMTTTSATQKEALTADYKIKKHKKK